jgi:hypothetical protein
MKRGDMTRPRIRLEQNADPTEPLKRIYRMGQGNYGPNSVKINEDGELTGGPTGFKYQVEEHYHNQSPEDFWAPNGVYENDTKSWARGGPAGGEQRPAFDRLNIARGSKGEDRSERITASGQDAPKSPFSSAYRRGSGECF